MSYQRVSKDKIRRHKKRAQEAVDKYEGYDSFLRLYNGHFAHNLRYKDQFKKDAVSLEGNKLDSFSSVYRNYRKKAPIEVDGQGLSQKATNALCNLQNFLSYFCLNDVCVEHNLRPYDVLLLLWVYQFEYVSIKYIQVNYHAKDNTIYTIINRLSKADLVRGTRIRNFDHPHGVRSSKKIKLTEQGNMLCQSFFQEVQKGTTFNFPHLPAPRGIQTILDENIYKKETDPLLVKKFRRSQDEVYPPAVSKQILKQMMRDREWNSNSVSKRILKGRYKRSAMEKYKSKELFLDLKAMRREMEEGDDEG